MKKNKWVLLLCMFLAFSHTSSADDNLFSMPLDDLMKIQITSASKVSQALRQIPASVTVMTRNDISHYGYNTFNEILRNMAGIYIEEDTEEIYIGTRGAIGGGVLFLLNGIPHHPSLQKSLTTVEANRMTIPVASIDRIEFIRGPMSVIYGNNAFQGVLNIITNLAKNNGVFSSLSSDGSGEVFLQGSHGDETGFLTINLGASKQGSYSGDYSDMMSTPQLAVMPQEAPTSMENHMTRQLRSLDISGKWHGLTSTLRYKKSTNGVYAASPPVDETYVVLEDWQGSLQYLVAMTERWQSRSTLIYSEEEYNIYDFNVRHPAVTGSQEQSSRRHEFEQNFIYQSDAEKSILLGYRYIKIDKVRNILNLVDGDDNYLANRDDGMEKAYEHDLFAQWQQELSNKLGLVAGFRYSRTPDNYLITREQPKENISSVSVLQHSELKNNDRSAWNSRVALLYQWDDRNQFKLLHGTASQDSASASFSAPKAIYTSELAHTFDTHSWLLNQGVYVSHIDKVVRRTVMYDDDAGKFVSSELNNGHWKSFGYELNVEYRPSFNWRLFASYNLQSTEDQKTTLNIGYSPRQLIKIKADYRYKKDIYAFYGHYVGARSSDWGFDEQTGAVSEEYNGVSSYWNMGATWHHVFSDRCSANLNISNLFDEQFRYPKNEVSDLDQGLIGLGRIATVSVAAKF